MRTGGQSPEVCPRKSVFRYRSSECHAVCDSRYLAIMNMAMKPCANREAEPSRNLSREHTGRCMTCIMYMDVSGDMFHLERMSDVTDV